MARTTTESGAVAVLKKDHASIERLFRRFERARGAAEKKRISDRIVREMSIHAAIEEQLVYPQLKRQMNGSVLLALEEHHVVKVELAEIEKLPAGDERLDPKVRVLAENVRRHIEEEERDLLPAMKQLLSHKELLDLAVLLERSKAAAPTRPHPAAPDEPPGNVLATPAAAAYDRGRDAMGRGIERSREMVGRGVDRGREVVGRRLDRVIERGREVVEEALRLGESAARRARNRLGRGMERAGTEVRAAGREVRAGAH
jgi:hemerythrin-like domain-containing protein